MENKTEQNQLVAERLPMQTEIEQLQQQANITPKDDATEQAATMVVAKAQRCIKSLETERKAAVKPLQEQIDTLNEPYKRAKLFFDGIKTRMQQALNQYRAEKARKAAEQLKKALEKFEQQQAKAVSKAEETGEAPVPVQAPKVYSGPAKSVDTGDEKVTWRTSKDWVLKQFPGWDKKERIYANDPRIKTLHEQHPELFILDPVRVNQAVKAGQALPDLLITEKQTTQVRGKG